jgi:phenylalanyl-tRNA synthetase beta chain
MAISTKWIKDYVDLNGVDLNALADKITCAGINIAGIKNMYISNLVIGLVTNCYPHPDSDHLNVCTVDLGGYTSQIVCGADNVKKGIKVIVSLPGAVLPGNFEIKKSVIRGVESNGMICALSEIGLEEETEETRKKGIYIIEDDSVEIGTDASVYMDLDDVSYELDLNPNRSDVKNHIPFSYEVGAVLNKKVNLPDTSHDEITDSINNYLQISVETEKCTTYNAKMVTDVKIKPTPNFIKQRLEIAGMRSINNVVDISNYVMLEYGQPLHFFDKDKVGNKILVRNAQENEKIITLDTKQRVLSGEDIVITDGVKPICIAGVMGGINSGIDENTKSIIIESAIFNPLSIRYTSIKNELRSEASLRYEKGLNYEYSLMALNRACSLLQKYADAKVLSNTISIDREIKTIKTVDFTIDDINSVLGMKLSEEDAINSLKGLDFEYTLNNHIFHVIIPNRRLDVEPHKNDLAEEIGRLYGFSKIEGVLPKCETKSGKYIGEVNYRKLITKRLRALGLNEVRTYTLVNDEMSMMFNYRTENRINLLNPMSEDKKILRTTLLPSLLQVKEYNKSHYIKDINIYEISNIYYNESEEDTLISILMSGNYYLKNWQGEEKKADFYLVKGIIENILEYLGFSNRYSFNKIKIDSLHPGISAEILLDRERVGIIGKVHPSISKEDTFVAELSLKKLYRYSIKPIKFKELPKYPSITKDVAFVIDNMVTSGEIIGTIKKSGGRLLNDIRVFDLYVGDKIELGKKSIAYSLTFMDETRTLTEEEVMITFNKIIEEVNTKYSSSIRDK